MKKHKLFFHTSGHKYKVGDVIGGPGKVVCLHTKPVPHGTIEEIVDSGHRSWKEYWEQRRKDLEVYWDAREEWNETQEGDKPQYPVTSSPKPCRLWVYKMKPYEYPTWCGVNDEFRAYFFVEVIGIEGNAKGIKDNHVKKFGRTSKAWHFGGKAIRYKK